jgi:PKD repeat protein
MVSHFLDGVLVNTAYHTSRPIIRLGFSRALVILLVAFMAASCGDDSGPPENQPPIAEFAAPACTEGLACTFTDTSTDPDGDETIASWAWDFGDGGTSDLQNPSHTFSSSGTYEVVLLIADIAGGTNGLLRQVAVSTPP